MLLDVALPQECIKQLITGSAGALARNERAARKAKFLRKSSRARHAVRARAPALPKLTSSFNRSLIFELPVLIRMKSGERIRAGRFVFLIVSPGRVWRLLTLPVQFQPKLKLPRIESGGRLTVETTVARLLVKCVNVVDER
jgi:hypothetical protein